MTFSSLCKLPPPSFALLSDPLSHRPHSLRPITSGALPSTHCICPSGMRFSKGGGARIVAEQKKYPPKFVEEDPTWVDDGTGKPVGAPQKEGGGLFGWVTNNKSSKEAIQLENTPAQDYNVGQMMAQIKDKGQEHGRFVAVPEGVNWWVRETKGFSLRRRPPVLLLHGAPSSSWSYIKTLKQLSDKGFHVYAPDWLGFGFSDKPAPGYEFTYAEAGFHSALDSLLETLGMPEQFYLVTHGFVLGSYGLTWALKNPERVAKLVILNTPLTAGGKLPLALNNLRLPFVGEFQSQNAVLAERFIEKGGPFVLDVEDADVYRIPYLNSSDAGFALLETLRQAPVNDLPGRLAAGFAPGKWDIPTLIAWGVADKYLRKSEAEEFAAINPEAIKVEYLEGAAHQPQDDWPEKLVAAMARFL